MMMLLALLVSAAEPSSYVLNPYRLDLENLTSAKEPPTAATWIQRSVQALKMEKAFSPPTASLRQKLKKASQEYLQMNLEESAELSAEVIDELYSQAPHPELYSLARDGMAIQALAAQKATLDSAYFHSDAELLKKLPLRVQTEWMEAAQSQKVSLSAIEGKNFIRVFLWGQEAKFPLSLAAGSYLFHGLTATEVLTYRLHIKERKIETNLLKAQDLWSTIEQKELRRVLMIPNKSKQTLLIALKSNSGSPQLIQISESLSPLASTPVSPTPNHQLAFDFKKDDVVTQEEESLWIESPWFWAITAVAIGGISYGVYEASRDRVVKFR